MSDPKQVHRCSWVNDDPLYVAYHDQEWGVPEYDNQGLFEKLMLDGAQAGLSWYIILKKRDGYRRAFDGFDPVKMARYTPHRVEKLLRDPGIVRNRLKVESAVTNARAYLAIMDALGSFSDYLWQYVDGRPIVNHWNHLHEVPASTPRSDAMSKDLKRRGFRFTGTTICYAFMQAVGMVNDHVTDCFRHPEICRINTR
jgi:DNA-3-methyladenine glycosylase I